MKTLYIDVFFFINFTVDLLAAHFSVRFCRINSSMPRLVTVSVLGAASAIVDVFLPEGILYSIVNSLSFLFLSGIFIAKRSSLFRRLRFVLLFFVSECIIGGIVYSAYSLLERHLGDYLSSIQGGGENRKALIFSALILLSIGVFKLMIMLFSSFSSEKSVHMKIKIGDKTVEADALVDSGNLVTDPMNMSPVLFVKNSVAEKLFPENVILLKEIDMLDRDYRKRIRLIPVTRGGKTQVMTGVRPDSVTVFNGKEENEINLTVAIDKEGGTYGGYELLAPAAVISDV